MQESHALADQFRQHFGHRQHLYGALLDQLADDLESGGPTAAICARHLDAPRGDAIQLRLLAGIFRLVLSGAAPELQSFYPSLGGTADPADAWPLLQPVLVRHQAELRAGLEMAPQTNEVGRAACLVLGIFDAVAEDGLHRVRLLEVGASAGLNLNVDCYRFTGRDWNYGPERSDLVIDTAARGVRTTPFTIVDRRGCDLAPVDVTTEAGATYLRSFVWPFDLERHQRLDAAIEIARRHAPIVDRASASSWLADQLQEAPDAEVLTVVWQSITEQYWPAAETAAVAQIITEARARMPLAHISMEGVPPTVASDGYDITLHGPTTCLDGTIIARSHHHGPPIALV